MKPRWRENRQQIGALLVNWTQLSLKNELKTEKSIAKAKWLCSLIHSFISFQVSLTLFCSSIQKISVKAKHSWVQSSQWKSFLVSRLFGLYKAKCFKIGPFGKLFGQPSEKDLKNGQVEREHDESLFQNVKEAFHNMCSKYLPDSALKVLYNFC